jgi:uncharacterized protein YggE
VTVAGDGNVEGTPDTASVDLGVQTQAPSAAAALASNNAKAQALLNRLESDGIAKKDLQTSGLSLQPVLTGPKNVLTGYQVTNSVTVTVHDLSLAGKLIDDAVSAAGNAVQVSDISFSIQNETALLGQARAAAVRQALDQAQLMAAAAGMKLGVLCSLEDNSSEPGPQPVSYSFSSAHAAGLPATPVEAGSQEISANVTAVYELVSGKAPSRK